MTSMQYESYTTNDNATIAYQTSVPLHQNTTTQSTNTASPSPSTCILLLHGFSGSSAYFDRNTTALSQTHWILAPDLRGHGRSSRPSHGYHVARLAMDLHELIQLVRLQHATTRIYLVGCSIGAAIAWTYTELFTGQDFAGLIFVDQAPLQDRSAFGGGWGAGLAHAGCYDEATTLAAQDAWANDDAGVRAEAHRGLVASCLGYRVEVRESDGVSEEERRADEEFFVEISAACDGVWLARLLADHTRYDHREAIELITRPVLLMAGKRSGCFTVEGMTETVRRAGGRAESVVFESGHWLFWEEPERFNAELLRFVASCEEVQ